MAPRPELQRFRLPPERRDVLAEAAARAIGAITGLLDGMAEGMHRLERLHELAGVAVSDTIRRAWQAPDRLLVELDELRGPLADLLLEATRGEAASRKGIDVAPPPAPSPPALWPRPTGDPVGLAKMVAEQTNWAFDLVRSRCVAVKRALIVLDRLCTSESGNLTRLTRSMRDLAAEL